MAERPNHWTMVGSAVDGALQFLGACVLVAAACNDAAVSLWSRIAVIALAGSVTAVLARHYLRPWLKRRNGGDHG